MIGNIHSRSIWRRKILQPFIFNFEKWGHSQRSPDFGNKIMELSPVTIKQEHRRMSNQHQDNKKYSSKGSNSVKTNSPNFHFQFEFYNKSKIYHHILNRHSSFNLNKAFQYKITNQVLNSLLLQTRPQ